MITWSSDSLKLLVIEFGMLDLISTVIQEGVGMNVPEIEAKCSGSLS